MKHFFAISAVMVFIYLMTTPALTIIIPSGANETNYRIHEADYPAVFPLFISNEGVKECGATLIAPSWAITAAHCTQPVLRGLKTSGKFKVTIAGNVVFFDDIVLHATAPSDETFTNETVDVALLHLSKPLTSVEPIRLYSESDEVGKTITMVGWGDLGSADTGPVGNDGQFRFAKNKVSDVDGHFLFFKFDRPESHEAVPFEAVGGPGDSGVPGLFMDEAGGIFLAGISSGQIPPDEGPDKPGVYGSIELFMRVSALRVWIEGVIRAP